jgi:Ca2+-binding RTX toxin-like protein
MRSLGFAFLALVLGATPASAAVVELDDRSSPEDDVATFAIVVRAAPGEANAISVRQVPGGIAIEDTGAPLTGACEPSDSGRFCPGAYGEVDVLLGDGSDSLDHSLSGFVSAGPGDDDIRVAAGFFGLVGGPGADRLDATGATGASVSYADHSTGVAVRLNGLADDGSAGEGDNVLGAVTGITGGSGHDLLEAGPLSSGVFGGDGHDRLLGSAGRETLNGGAGDDELLAGGGNDFLSGEAGADVLSGGAGLDEVSYGGGAPMRLSIGDGPNDGAAGEGDDVRDDVEALSSGFGPDVLIGNEQSNRLIGHGGRDVLRGGAGADELIGWDDGDELDAGPGADRVVAGAEDHPLLLDGERDRLDCRSRAPSIQADVFDRLLTCAPQARLARLRKVRGRRAMRVRVGCPRASQVACEGRVWIKRVRGRTRISRRRHFGPVRPGRRRTVTLRLTRRIGRGACATARTRRHDGFANATPTLSTVACASG